MKTVKCKNCGASFDENLEKCPYCGTMNKKGAYRSFRLKIASMIDSVLGLKDDIHNSVSKIIWNSLLRAVILIALTVGLAFVCSRFTKVNYYSDKEYDQEAYEEIVWLDEHLDEMNKAYENGDFDTIGKLYVENAHAVLNWPMYPAYCLKKEYNNIMSDNTMSTYLLRNILYFCYNPDYFVGFSSSAKIDQSIYEEFRKGVVEKAASFGYSEEELESIFSKVADSYQYINYDMLKEYVKEDSNG